MDAPQIDFGAMYMGERMQRVVQLFNGCPTEAHFDLSFGPATEMGPADASGPMGAQSDDPHASFLRLARIRVRKAHGSTRLAGRGKLLLSVIIIHCFLV